MKETVESIEISVKYKKRTVKGDTKRVKMLGTVGDFLVTSRSHIEHQLSQINLDESKYPNEYVSSIEQIDFDEIQSLYEKNKRSEHSGLIKSFVSISKNLYYIWQTMDYYYQGAEDALKRSWTGNIKKRVKQIARTLNNIESLKE